ncbi:hypothetical protein [Halobellus captivus]|uniref:hypothetical protein n=1 Tax=Halobellus captivus TaxID=2592614 RepID=UPI0011A4BDD9|nr:hypothetical protein [Halobellus captivus]
MAVSRSDRAQATLIGFIILFGFLVIIYAGFQAYVVPNQNAEVEYNHYQEVREDMTDLYTEAVSLGMSSKSGQVLVPVDLGTNYPSRLFFINPPPAAGSIGTTNRGEISVTFADGSGSTTDLCGGATTAGITYTPSYSVTEQPEIRYENGLLYVETAAGEYAMLEQQRVVNESSNTVRLYRLQGTLQTRSNVGTLPIELTGTRTYGTTTREIERVTLPSELPAATWNDRVLPDDPDITANQNGSGSVDITFTGGESYQVQCFTVGLGENPETNFANATTY